MIGISATVTDQASPAIRRVAVAATGRGAHVAMAGSVAQIIRDHLVAKDQVPNKLGGRRTHFYASAAQQTHWQAAENFAEVVISKDGIRQRLLGTVPEGMGPVNRRVLTVPIHAMAHGRAAPEFGDELRLVRLNGGRDGHTVGLLVLANDPESTALYVLRTLVKQAPDPSVLPTDDELRQAALDGLEELRLADA